MHEIRLAVCSPDEPTCAGIAARLRGTIVGPCADLAGFRGPPDGYDVAMLVGRGWQWRDAVDQLLAAGAHVLLVADPCPPADLVEHLSRSARTAGVQLAVVNPDRYLPSRQLVRQQMAAIGEAGLIRLHRWEPTADHSPEPPQLPDPLLRDIDLALRLTGRLPDRVYAVEQKSDGIAGRCLQVHLGFPGGGMALLDYTDRLPDGEGYQSLSVIASAGAAYTDDHQNAQLLYRGGCPQAIRTEERAGHLAAIVQEFVDALREGRDLTAASATAWRNTYAVAEAVRQSLASGRAVTLEDR
jgi:predicted dehydrogenase